MKTRFILTLGLSCEQRSRHRIILEGDVPSPINPKENCRFEGRCPYVMDICRKVRPEFREVKKDHFVACHRADEIINGTLK